MYAHLFLRSKVVDNVKELPDLLGCLALDHVGNGLASDITANRRVRIEAIGAVGISLQ